MKSLRTYSGLVMAIVFAAVVGCVSGNVRLSRMTAQDIRETFKIEVTTMADVRAALGEPMQKGVETVKGTNSDAVAHTVVIWYYEYQKVSGRFFLPIPPPRPQDNSHARLMLGFGTSDVLEHVDYYGNQ